MKTKDTVEDHIEQYKTTSHSITTIFWSLITKSKTSYFWIEHFKRRARRENKLKSIIYSIIYSVI